MTRAAVAAAGGPVHFYCSSGGNAGLACATSAVALRRPATIVVPTTTSDLMKRKLLDLGVDVVQTGKNLAAADYLRAELLAKDPDGVYVPPFDHPHVWEGASTIVAELRDQMDGPVDALVCSVGSGGLFNGLMQGIERFPWSGAKPHVVCIETAGADSLNACLRAGAHVTLPEITSIATSLGCSRVSAETWRWIQALHAHSLVVSDADAAVSCVRFADDARHLVKVSCGAALAIVYRGDLRACLGCGLTDEWTRKNVVIICGGSGVTLDILDPYRREYAGQTAIKV